MKSSQAEGQTYAIERYPNVRVNAPRGFPCSGKRVETAHVPAHVPVTNISLDVSKDPRGLPYAGGRYVDAAHVPATAHCRSTLFYRSV